MWVGSGEPRVLRGPFSFTSLTPRLQPQESGQRGLQVSSGTEKIKWSEASGQEGG